MMKKISRHPGFTLLEVMMTIAITATLLTGIFTLLYEGMASRVKADKLETAIYLAGAKMRLLYADRRPKTGSTEGEFEEHPSFRFETKITEEELDLLQGIKEKGEGGKEDKTPSKLQGSGSVISDAIKDKGMSLESATGGIIPLTRILVTVYYNEDKKEKKYELESFKLAF